MGGERDDDVSGRPLEGVLVVSVEQAVAAPLATRHLADHGARVIKVERPGTGDFARHYDRAVAGQSAYFLWLNRSKESLELDLSDPGSRPVLDSLLERADVLVQNLGPGAADRLGLGADDLRRRHPRLVVCRITGYGADGPWAGRKAYDLLVQAEAGLVAATGSPEAPAKAGISVADIAAGMYAFSGILLALLRRAASGDGALVDVTLLDALAEWMTVPATTALATGRPPPRSGAHHAGIAPYGPYPAGDGIPVVVAVQNQPEWEAMCRAVLGRPELAEDARFRSNPDRVANRAALDAVLAERFSSLTAADLEALLDAAGIAHGRLNQVADLRHHPVVEARGRWREVPSPGGPVPALVPPVALDGADPALGPVPALGEHTRAILAELGFPTGATGR